MRLQYTQTVLGCLILRDSCCGPNLAFWILLLPFELLLLRFLDFHTKKTNIPAATASAAIDPTTAPTITRPLVPGKHEKNNISIYASKNYMFEILRLTILVMMPFSTRTTFLFNLRQITQKPNKMWFWYPQEEVQLSIRAKLKAFHQYPSLTYSLWRFKNN